MTQPSYPVSTIAKLFNLTERRVQQLAKDGIIPKANKGKYELVPYNAPQNSDQKTLTTWVMLVNFFSN